MCNTPIGVYTIVYTQWSDIYRLVNLIMMNSLGPSLAYFDLNCLESKQSKNSWMLKSIFNDDLKFRSKLSSVE